MCLAVPARVVELIGDTSARVEIGGVCKDVSLALLDGVAVGDYVIIHVGYALTGSMRRKRNARLTSSSGWREVRRRIPGWPPGAGAGKCDPPRCQPGRTIIDGVLRWTHACHLALRPDRPAAGQRPSGARAGLPGVRAAVGVIDRAIALARQPGVIFASYGDPMRVPATGRQSLLRRGQTAPTCAWCIRAWTRCDLPSSIRSGRWCFLASALRPPRLPARSPSCVPASWV